MANQKGKKNIRPKSVTGKNAKVSKKTSNEGGDTSQKTKSTKTSENIGTQQSTRSLVSPKIQACIYGALAFSVTAFLLFGVIGKNQVLDRLSHIEHARGLITFILTVGTISIAILVTLGALMARDDDAKERFYRAKEILTILVGVLGTIVGFYFGSQDDTANRADLSAATPILSAYSTNPGVELSLVSFVTGGKPPYKYELSFQDNLIGKIVGYVDDTGWISEKIIAPQTENPQTIQYSLNITDAEEERFSYISEKEKYIVVNP